MDLLGKGIVWRWGLPQQCVFEQLKVALTTAPVLALADPTLPYQIETNASDMAIGDVLMKNARPVAFFSRKLRAAKKNYSFTDRKFLAIHPSTRRWCCYLHGACCAMFTDHEP